MALSQSAEAFPCVTPLREFLSYTLTGLRPPVQRTNTMSRFLATAPARVIVAAICSRRLSNSVLQLYSRPKLELKW